MNVNVLIDSIVRQTTVLIAQLATAAGTRAPLAHVANQVFAQLVAELRQQGLGNKVIADMFGLALRTYHSRVRRLSESATERGRSLWEAVHDHVRQHGTVLRADVLTRFRNDDEATTVRGVLHDLVDSGILFRSGRGDATSFRAAGPEDQIATNGTHGCEVIEGSLALRGYAVIRPFLAQPPPPSLEALSRLREIRGGFDADYCVIESLNNLPRLEKVADLLLVTCNGIDPAIPPGLTVTESLTVYSPVTSLGGLRLASEMASVHLEGRALVNADALITLERVGRLVVAGTGLQNLDALSNLRRVDRELLIDDNIELSNVEGLSGLEAATELRFRGNSALRTLPTFPALTRLSRLSLQGNSRLEVGPDLPALRSLPVPEEEDPRRDPAGARINNNRSLRSLGLSALTQSHALYITNNASLESIAFPRLRQVDDRLSVASNPRLPKSELLPLGQVAAGSLNVDGNLGANGQTACPWPDDAVCDESSGLCRAGTDPDCR